MGRPLIVVLAAVLAGCGSVAREAGDDSGSGIRAVDRPAPDAWKRWAHPDAPYEIIVASGSMCLAELGDTDVDTDCETRWKRWEDSCAQKVKTDPVCEALLEEARKAHERWIAQMAPAPGTEPRVVAELDLEEAHTVQLVAWRTAKDHLCGLARVPAMAADAEVFVGECVEGTSCEEICPGRLVADDGRIWLVGMVAESADAVRVTTEAGRVVLQALDGPTIHDSKQEALIVDVGAEVWRKIEVFREGRSIKRIEIEIPGLDADLWACYAARPIEECEEREVELGK